MLRFSVRRLEFRRLVSYVSAAARNGSKTYWKVDDEGIRHRIQLSDVPQGVTIVADTMEGSARKTRTPKVNPVGDDPFARLKGTQPWEAGRRLLEVGSFEEAHTLIGEAIDGVLKLQKQHPKLPDPHWMLPLLLLELGKAFLKLSEHQDAMSAFGHAKYMFEGIFDEEVETLQFVHEPVFRERYREMMLHYAKLNYLCGQFADAEQLWKKTIQYCMKTVGRDCYDILVATNGLSEYYLEQLRLQDASRFTAAAVELARELLDRDPKDDHERRQLRERLAEALSMSGLVHVQQKHYDAANEFYQKALTEIEGMESAAEGKLDNFLATAFFNIYRNIEHMYRAKGDEEKAQAIAGLRVEKLGKYQDVDLAEEELADADDVETEEVHTSSERHGSLDEIPVASDPMVSKKQ